MKKTKAGKYFHNLFLMSVLFHLVLFSLLNIQKAQRIVFVKNKLINTFQQLELFDMRQNILDSPQKTKIEIDPQIKSEKNIIEADKEIEQVESIEKMLIDERDLSEKQFFNKLLDIKTDVGKNNFSEEIIGKANVSMIFGEAGLNNNTENIMNVTDFSKENITEEFKRKKIPKDFLREGTSSNRPNNMGMVERSDKVTITAVRVWVDSNGKVIKAEIAKSSGYIELDQLALNSIRKRDFMPDKIESVRIAVIEIDFTNIR